MEYRSFEEFYNDQYASVLAFGHALTGDRTSAEDVVHDAFVTAMERWNEIVNPPAWIRRVVGNNATSEWRRKQAEGRAVTRLRTEGHPPDELSEGTYEFWRTVASLPPKQGQAVALYYLEDQPVRAIAVVLGCKESTARGHLSKGRRRLAKLLRVHDG